MKRPAIHELDDRGFADDYKKQMASGWMSLNQVQEVVNNHFWRHSIAAVMPAENLLGRFCFLNGYSATGAGQVTWTDLSVVCFKGEGPINLEGRTEHLFIPADWGHQIIDFAREGYTHVTLRQDNSEPPRIAFMLIAHDKDGKRFVVKRENRRFKFIPDKVPAVAVTA